MDTCSAFRGKHSIGVNNFILQISLETLLETIPETMLRNSLFETLVTSFLIVCLLTFYEALVFSITMSTDRLATRAASFFLIFVDSSQSHEFFFLVLLVSNKVKTPAFQAGRFIILNMVAISQEKGGIWTIGMEADQRQLFFSLSDNYNSRFPIYITIFYH
ncbi:MAG: hypothetical protein KKF30_10765 [Proteobacteria bacterium]|nr:hypothetical protein [Pseudomonadota bacterium]MBU4470859.1 hypothetical protein [Pseudomonadota bacterium]MCG2753779.1 hypothetical protein [Desulfobacteraceae bacterium]